MKRILIDCSSGISGGMFLGALADLGCDFTPLQTAFHKAGLKLDIKLRHVSRASGPGTLTEIRLAGNPAGRNLREVAEILGKLGASKSVRTKSMAMLERLAESEAQAHGTDADLVTFQLVSVVEVVSAAWALEELAVNEVNSRPAPWFGGFADGENGKASLPLPATLVLLKDKPVFESGAMEELITPVGALLLDTLVDDFISAPPPPGPANRLAGSLAALGIFEKSGLGYGGPEPADKSGWSGRGLRLHLFSLLPAQEETPYIIDEVYKISCHIDHLTGEEIGHAITMLGKAGVLDVLWLPGLTKKNRPAGELRVLCMIDMLPKIEREIFKHTHTLGIRVSRQARVTLPRKAAELDSPWGTLDAKEYKLLDQTFTKAEYEALAETAAREGIGLPALRVFEKKTK